MNAELFALVAVMVLRGRRGQGVAGLAEEIALECWESDRKECPRDDHTDIGPGFLWSCFSDSVDCLFPSECLVEQRTVEQVYKPIPPGVEERWLK